LQELYTLPRHNAWQFRYKNYRGPPARYKKLTMHKSVMQDTVGIMPATIQQYRDK
jgi:hypothetical protein